MTMVRWIVWSAAVLILAGLTVSCQTGGGLNGPGGGAEQGPSALTTAHLGKRVRAVLRMGAQTVIGRVVAVEPANDAAAVETDYGSRIGFKISHVSILEEFGAAQAPTPPSDRPEMTPHQRHTFADRVGGQPDKVENPTNIQVLVVDFRHQHRCAECLKDLEEALLSAPSSAIFSDKASTVTVKTQVPKDPNASLVPFSWHAHVLGGTKEAPTDTLVTQDTDGDLSFALKDHPGARQFVLVGTPHKIENKLYGVNAIAPPRMFAFDIFDSSKSGGILENNRAIMHGLDLKAGKLYVASQPANDSEMVLSVYDPERRNTAVFPTLKFSVQDALLIPAVTVAVADPQGQVWQKLGAYPIPPFLSHETADLHRVAVEINGVKRGEFGGPPIAAVRASENANVKTEVDIRYQGLSTERAYRAVFAHGHPGADKAKLYSPTAKDVKADTKHEVVAIDLSKAEESAFPFQLFFWSQLSAPWKTTGGFMEGTTPMTVPKTTKVPRRRAAVYPAHSPGLRFVSFAGPRADAAVATPAVLGTNGVGGATIGTGGSYVPFSPMVGIGFLGASGKGSGGSETAKEEDSDPTGTAPLVIPATSPHVCSTATANANASAGAVAIATCSCSGGGCGDGNGSDGGGKGGQGGSGKEPPKYPDTPTPGHSPGMKGGGWNPDGPPPTPVSPGGSPGGLNFGATSGW